jgi:hypothetical protein
MHSLKYVKLHTFQSLPRIHPLIGLILCSLFSGQNDFLELVDLGLLRYGRPQTLREEEEEDTSHSLD